MLLAIIVFAISIPVFWLFFSASVDRISRDVVDTRMLEFADQVRGYRASRQALAPAQAEKGKLLVSQTGLGGPDIDWVWQISAQEKPVLRSELLRIVDVTIPPNIQGRAKQFAFSTRQSPLGLMRIAERILDEPAAAAGENPTTVHYLVGLNEIRYAAYVEDHAKRLGDLTIIGVIVMSAGIFALLALIVVLAQHQLAGVRTALATYEEGESEGIEGHFPSEIQSVINLMNDLLLRNQKLIERTRKYVSKITHDINHPLAILKNGLKGNVDSALLNRQVDRMTGLVDRYASLARAIGPEGESRKKTDVATSLRDTASGFSILYRRTPLEINCQADEQLSFIIPQHDLEAAVSNLVSNAHKYAETEILIAARLIGRDLEITVEDDGPGIPDNQMKTALNWGKRLDESPPGTGFGLSIVSDILDLYGGKITLSASPMGGLKATLLFPGPRHFSRSL